MAGSRNLAGRLEQALGAAVGDVRSLGGQHGVAHYRLELPGGRAAFAKIAGDGAADPGFAAEASGLRWLAGADAVAVPEVLGWDDGLLALSWIPPGRPDEHAARRFGQELAALHAAGADRFGAPWPGVIAGLPLPNAAAAGATWPDWYVSARLLPYLRRARDEDLLSAADVRLIESAAARAAALAGPPEPPSRIHGDCWSGNIIWSGGRGWLVDPAAHGGHRETDLAMLALFGVPFLDQIRAGYQERAPLADGWPERVPLHQLHPLLVHVCLFGAAYTEAVLSASWAVLSR
ncbi:MAG TPA: fructosamine kinase family protein [Streptosporangiaceae bacterium]|jgi:fructosamine-3-kinase